MKHIKFEIPTRPAEDMPIVLEIRKEVRVRGTNMRGVRA